MSARGCGDDGGARVRDGGGDVRAHHLHRGGDGDDARVHLRDGGDAHARRENAASDLSFLFPCLYVFKFFRKQKYHTVSATWLQTSSHCAVALRADAFHHKSGSVNYISFRQFNVRDMLFAKAECLMARLAEKVHVRVLIKFRMRVTLAQLV